MIIIYLIHLKTLFFIYLLILNNMKKLNKINLNQQTAIPKKKFLLPELSNTSISSSESRPKQSLPRNIHRHGNPVWNRIIQSIPNKTTMHT